MFSKVFVCLGYSSGWCKTLLAFLSFYYQLTIRGYAQIIISGYAKMFFTLATFNSRFLLDAFVLKLLYQNKRIFFPFSICWLHNYKTFVILKEYCDQQGYKLFHDEGRYHRETHESENERVKFRVILRKIPVKQIILNIRDSNMDPLVKVCVI